MTFIDVDRHWSGVFNCIILNLDPERQGDVLRNWQQPRVQPTTRPVSFLSSTWFFQPGGTDSGVGGKRIGHLIILGIFHLIILWSRKAGQVGRKGVSRFPGLPRAPSILGPTSSTPSSEPQDSCLPVLQAALGCRLQCGSCLGSNSEMACALLRVSKLLYK